MALVASLTEEAACREAGAEYPEVMSHKSPIYEAFNGMEHWTSDTLNIDFSQILPQMEKASQNLPCATCQTLTALT